MIVSSDLFELIRSLSKTEKAYFKKKSEVFFREGESKYIQLFDAISGQEFYSEKEIIELFKGEKFVRQFSVAKNYLYNRILDTMQSYRSSVLSEVQGLMNKSDYLFEKGLYRQADKLLRMAEKIARKHELHSVLVTIYEHQMFGQAIKKREPGIAEKNIDRSQKEILLLNNHLKYLKLIAKTQHVYNLFGKTKNKKYLQTFKKIMQNPLLKDESRAITFNGKRRFYDIHAVFNSIMGNEEKAYTFSKKIISLFDKNPEKKKQDAISFAGYINNTLLFCHFLRKYKETESYLKKLNEIGPMMITKYQKARFFEIYTNNCLNFYNSTGQFDEANKILPSFINEIPEHGKKLADRDNLLLFGNIAYTFFGLEDYKNCLAWINKIRNELPLNIRPDLESEIGLLNIIVHNELGHTELMPHLITSYYRFLSKKEIITKPEKYLLAYFRKPSAANTEEKPIKRMTELRNKIDGYINENSHKPTFMPLFFDIVSWLESKIQKQTFAEIMREKTKKIYKEKF